MTSFLPTKKYYYLVIDKIYGITSELNEGNSRKLLEGLVQEVPALTGNEEGLRKLLVLIDGISVKFTSRPMPELNPLIKTLSKIALDNFESSQFNISLECINKYIDDKRLSLDDAQVCFDNLFGGLNSCDNFNRTQKISEFIINNKKRLNDTTREKFFSIFVREVLDAKTYDTAKFPKYEAIMYWDGVASRVFDFTQDANQLVKNIDINRGVLSSSSALLNPDQKCLLTKAILKGWDKYLDDTKIAFLRLFTPYLRVPQENSIIWGIDRINEILVLLKDTDRIDSAVQQDVVTSLEQSYPHIKNETARKNAFLILVFFDKTAISLGEQFINRMLSEIAFDLISGNNSSVAFDAFLKHHSVFKLNDRIKTCGLYLGSPVFSKENTPKLITCIVQSLPKTLPPTLNDKSVDDNVVPATTPESLPKASPVYAELDYVEQYLVNISADERAWTFFADLFLHLQSSIDNSVLCAIASSNISKIKNDDEPSHVSRNRFSILNILKNKKCYSDADINGIFNKLFSEDSQEKVILACDLFEVYFPKDEHSNRKNRNSYKYTIEQTLERNKDNEALRERLSALLN